MTSVSQMLSQAKPPSLLSLAGMAFALLANLPAVNGLYSSFFPLLTYFFLGGIHQMVPGKVTSHLHPLPNSPSSPHPPPLSMMTWTGHGEGSYISTFILLELMLIQPERMVDASVLGP